MNTDEFRSLMMIIQHEADNNFQKAEALCLNLIQTVEELLSSRNYENRRDAIIMYSRALCQQSELLLRQGNPKKSLVFAQKSHSYAIDSKDKHQLAATSNLLGRIYADLSEYQLALEFYTITSVIYNELGDKLSESRTIGNIGILYQNQGDYLQAKDNYFKALATYEELGMRDDIARVYVNIGLVYQNTSDFQKSLEYYSKSLDIFEELGDKVAISIVTGNIAIIFNFLFDYNRALEYFKISLEAKEKLGMKSSAALVMGNIGDIYKYIKNYPLALEYLSKALAVHEEMGKKMEAAVWTGSIGMIYSELDENYLALEFLLKSLAVHEQLGRKAEIARVTGDIGVIYAKRKFNGFDPLKAEDYFLKAISMSEQLGVKHHLQSVCKSLSELYENEERWKESITFYKKFHELEKEILNEESRKLADKFAYERQIAEQEKRIAVEQARNEEILRQQHILEEQAAKILIKNNELQEINAKLDSAYNLLAEQAAKIQITNTELQEKNIELDIANNQLIEQAAKIQIKNTELHETNIELNDANRKLEEAGKFKMKILGIASHDLKNPIAGINMSAEMLIKYAALPPEIVRTLEMITTSSKRMLDIVVNLMDIAARQLGQIKLSRTVSDIAALTMDVSNDYLHRAAEKKQIIEFFIEGNCTCSVDPERLRQVLDNIISNAVKYSEREKNIRVAVIAVNDKVTISVTDHGQGLSDEDKLLLFNDFQRLSSRPTGGESSSGLGLSVVKHLVELHGGKVWAESEGKGKGSTFFVELPR